jgi:hypothetical protein
MYSRAAQLSQMLLGTAPPPPLPPPPPPTTATGSATAAGPDVTPMSPLPARLLALLAAQPARLASPPDETAEKLLVMQSLFEIPRALALELVLREPGGLGVWVGGRMEEDRSMATSGKEWVYRVEADCQQAGGRAARRGCGEEGRGGTGPRGVRTAGRAPLSVDDDQIKMCNLGQPMYFLPDG